MVEALNVKTALHFLALPPHLVDRAAPFASGMTMVGLGAHLTLARRDA